MRLKILFVGGATGGHLYPAVALADELRRRGEVDPIFLSVPSARGEGERSLVETILEPAGMRTLCGESLPRGAPLRWPSCLRRVSRVLGSEPIDAVVALGGRPGVIPGLWARWQRKPLFLLEQNRVLGRANRLLLPLAERIFLSFADTAPESKLRSRAVRLGCPVRPSFVPTPPVEGTPTILVLGGSQGAKDLNELAVTALTASSHRWRVHHICGPGKESGLADRYRSAGVLATVRPFLQDPAAALRGASLVLARAGGSTIAELTAVGRGSLLLPYPHHRDRHQFMNAEALVEQGAAEVIDLSSEGLIGRLDHFFLDREARDALSFAARKIGSPDATSRIADVLATHLDCDPLRRQEAQGTGDSGTGDAGLGRDGTGGGHEISKVQLA